MMAIRRWASSALMCTLLAALALPATVHARRTVVEPGTIAATELPKEGRELLDRIADGGPFSYSRDGVVFGNREKQLPAEPRGYYREYTVQTPGNHNRGARRIVCGGDLRRPAACWYSDDHYQSFRRIRF